MKSPLEAPEKQIAEETSAKPERPAPAVIDTSKMAKGQREALETSRRITVPFLEKLDRQRVTRRIGDKRVLA